ncbi:MAG: ATP-binding protein [Floccifex sp.]
MFRNIYNDLVKWKNSIYRKPLILNGARQTGKTWILKEFGKKEYQNVAYINCDNNREMKEIFYDFDIERLILSFSVLANTHIEKGNTLIILDEIQECPLGITSLKYFQENAPEYHIVAAGNLLGVRLHYSTGFPVGKVDQLNLYPMSFKEFLMALNEDILIEQMENHKWKQIDVFHEKIKNLLRQYYYVGGMPEVVEYYTQTKEVFHVRELQNKILMDYRQDFSKHIPKNMLAKVNLVWDSIPAQLSKENKKFIYGMLKKGGRAKEFEDAIQWLVDAGLVFRVNRVNKICMPLKFYEDFNSFKLFVLDLGLLGAMVDAPAKNILIGDNVFKEYKGAFTEQYVAQQIVSCNINPKYFTNENSTNEIDFVVQMEQVYPIEVKAEQNLKSKSLNTVLDNNKDMEGWRFSMSLYREFKQIINIPLYDVEEWLIMKKSK